MLDTGKQALCMCGSRNFCQGVHALLPESVQTTFFLNPQLILQWFIDVIFSKENYNFQGFRGGPTFSGGGGRGGRVQHFPGVPTFSRGGSKR